jgi:hypothetical protein
MSLAGQTTGHEPASLIAVARAFQIGSLAYPVVYIISLVAALVAGRKKEALAEKIGLIPLCYLVLLGCLLAGWAALDRS